MVQIQSPVIQLAACSRKYVPVLVELEVGDNNLAGVDADGDGSTVRLVALDTVDVDNPLLAVHLGHLALTTLVLAPDDPDLVILADGY